MNTVTPETDLVLPWGMKNDEEGVKDMEERHQSKSHNTKELSSA